MGKVLELGSFQTVDAPKTGNTSFCMHLCKLLGGGEAASKTKGNR